MKYTRAKFAKYSGVKIDTLRYYEECGLLPVQYNEEKKQYEYGDEAIFNVFLIRELRQVGYSIDDVKQSMTIGTWNMDAQIEAINEKIENLEETRDQLVAMNNILKRNKLNTYIDSVRLDTYFYDFGAAAKYDKDRENGKEWIKAIPFAWANVVFEYDLYHGNDEFIPMSICLGIQKKYAEKRISKLNEPYIKHAKAHEIIRFNVRTKHIDSVERTELLPLLTYCEERGYKLNGVFGGLLKSTRINELGEREYIFGMLAEYEK